MVAIEPLRTLGLHMAGGGGHLLGRRGPLGGDVHRGCLQAGQYASVFVDNGSGAALTVQSGSSFSGLLLGT